MATPNSMEIVEEGPLESISRPTSGTTKYGKAGESTSRPSTADRSFLMEMLPADLVDDELKMHDNLTLEDVVDSDTDVDDISSARDADTKELQVVNTSNSNRGHHSDSDMTKSYEDKRSDSADSSKEDVDPKIAKGLEKIKKLDSLLEEVARKEKDAKEDRRRVEKELRLQLRGLLEEKSSLLKRVGNNVQHILALCEPEDTDEVNTENQLRTSEFSPVFQTQIDIDDHILSDREKSASSGKSKHLHDSSQSTTRESSRRSSASEKGTQRKSKMSSSRSKDGKKSKQADKNKQQNFIERNIKLASHAGDVVALTEDERKRLDALLSDESDLFTEGNPFSSVSLPLQSTGYRFEPDDSASLLRIDAKLKELIPDEEYNSICLTWRSDGTSAESYTSRTQELLSDSKDDESIRQDTLRDNSSFKADLASSRIPDNSAHSNVGEDDDCCGEHTLQERKKSREAQQRLVTIEKQLKDMQQYDECMDAPLQLISNDLLRQLIDVDSRATSTAMSIKDVSGRLSVSDAEMSDLASNVSKSEYDHDNMSVTIDES